MTVLIQYGEEEKGAHISQDKLNPHPTTKARAQAVGGQEKNKGEM